MRWRNTVVIPLYALCAKMISAELFLLRGVQCRPAPMVAAYSISMAHANRLRCQMLKENNRHECAIYGKTCMWVNYATVVFCLDLADLWPFFFCFPTICRALHTRVHLLFSFFFCFCEIVTEQTANGNFFCEFSKWCTYSTKWRCSSMRRHDFFWSNRSRSGSEIIVRGIFCDLYNFIFNNFCTQMDFVRTREKWEQEEKMIAAHGPNDSPAKNNHQGAEDMYVYAQQFTSSNHYLLYFGVENVDVLLWSMISWKIKMCITQYTREIVCWVRRVLKAVSSST